MPSPEKACIAEQEIVARDVLDRRAAARSGMADLFGGDTGGNEVAFRDDRQAALAALGANLEAWLRSGRPRRYDDLMATLMQQPLIYRTDCMALLRQAEQDGKVSFVVGARGPAALITPSPFRS